MTPWLYLQAKFDSMPKWVRNVTYLTILLLTVYLYLTPQFVSGQIVARKASGGIVPYRGVAIQTQIDGHLLKFTTDEFGFWSIPVVHRIPGSIKLQVFHQDDRSWFPVEISASAVWTKDFVIVVSNDPRGVSMEFAERGRSVSAVLASVRNTLGMRQATAGALLGDVFGGPRRNSAGAGEGSGQTDTSRDSGASEPESEGVVRRGAGLSPSEAERLDEIGNSVAATIADVLGVRPSSVERGFPIGGASSLSYIERIQIVEAAESVFGLKIPDEHWRRLATAGELTDYVKDRLFLEDQYPEVKQTQFPNSWAEIQQSIPAEKRPIFSED